MVLLPLAEAGISAYRLTFAGQFASELTQAGEHSGLDAWLHPLPAYAAVKSRLIENLSSRTGVLVVLGIFGECLDIQALPFNDEITRPRSLNYTEGYSHYALDLGSVRAVHVKDRASSETNEKIIAFAIQQEVARTDIEKIIVVAFSKGLPDTLVALQHLHARAELPIKLKAVVSVSGVVLGTLMADNFSVLYTNLLQPLSPLGCPKSLDDEVESLTVGRRTAWLVANSLPAQIATFFIVAYATREEIAPVLRPFFDVLSRVDSLNDSQVYVAWSILPRANLLAELRSDHWPTC